MNDQMCDQLSFKEYEDPFKNVADFDEDDSPEIPTDGRISKEKSDATCGWRRSLCAFRRGWY